MSPTYPIIRSFSLLRLSVMLLLALVLGMGWPYQATAQGDEESTHVVRYGETLSEIAVAYGVSTQQLMETNRIGNANAIYVGQRLAVPPAPPSAEPSPPQVVGGEASIADLPLVSSASLNRVYQVRPGDTLDWIALRFGVDTPSLMALNRLESSRSIRIGQSLILPATHNELRVQPQTLSYEIRSGDSLGMIAERFSVPMNLLMSLNRIQNPNLIQPGQRLQIPESAGTGSAPKLSLAQRGFHYHNVAVGESLSRLALDYNSTPLAIVAYNNLPDTETVFSGLELRIPYGPPILDRRRPPSPQSGTEFIISISRQQCWVMQGDRLIHEWRCSTGFGEWVTRTGTFPVQSKIDMAQSSAYRLDMPYWLGLYYVGSFENGIHGLPIDWDSGEKIWDQLIGQPATFGCAMLMDEDAERLFNLAYLGMRVHIVD
jgi:LysM repeat protein